MKINNIKSLEKNARILSEQIKNCKNEPNTPEETTVLQELEAELNRVSGHLNNLRLIKNSPPGVIINFLKGYVQQYLPALSESIKFDIMDEKRIKVLINADFLGYNLAVNEQYDPVNEQHTEAWETFHERTDRKTHPYRPIINRLNELDKDFSGEISDYSYDYNSLELDFKFTKVHASSEVLTQIWPDVMREVVAVCNLHRTRQGLDPL